MHSAKQVIAGDSNRVLFQDKYDILTLAANTSSIKTSKSKKFTKYLFSKFKQ